jgi:hypothetical protein
MDVKKEQELLHEMFQSEGWKCLSDRLKEQQDALNQLGSVDSEKQLFFNKGRVFETMQLLALPDMVRKALDDPEEEDYTDDF